jgi:protocatechuate 3,4-dioxygenase beta subunit
MPLHTRRQAILAGAAALAAGPALARSIGLVPTPAQTEGPFYPRRLPDETDPDLTRNGGRVAKGEILALSGRVLGVDGQPVRGAMVEIWQCDAEGRYLAAGPIDPGFQGFGRARVDGEGGYAFRTLKPVPYPGRAPHVHIKVYRPDAPVLTTQFLIEGDPLNARDGVLRALAPADQARVLARLEREAGGWRTQFDLVVA